MKKKYVVRFEFTATFEAENDGKALIDAAYALRYGIEETRRTKLEVIAAITLPTEAETPAPEEKTASSPATISDNPL